MNRTMLIHPEDTVGIALVDLPAGEEATLGGHTVTLTAAVPAGHKFALVPMKQGEDILRYGAPIGHATEDIGAGAWVHSHNLATNLSENLEYTYQPRETTLPTIEGGTFMGYPREKGNPGVRNEVWVIPTVGCINRLADNLANEMHQKRPEGVDGVYAFGHPYGCSQLGDDLENTQKILSGMVHHPNAGGVLVLGLGCENNLVKYFKEIVGDYNPDRVKFMVVQETQNEMEEGAKLIEELCDYAAQTKREPCDVSGLVVGLKCGGSDSFSGITANPLLGHFSDRLVGAGGNTLLTEVPEWFGAETLLMERAASEEVFQEIVATVNDFKEYYRKNNQPIYENPSPGNKEGGITTLEEKSLGNIQKGGSAPIVDVLAYGEGIQKVGHSLLDGPGNDLVSSTNMAASGAQIVLFTTGRGTPYGSFVPTVKLSTNTPLAEKKPHWIDFDAGLLLDGTSFAEACTALYDYVIDVASGEQTNNERYNIREIAIFKTGVTL